MKNKHKKINKLDLKQNSLKKNKPEAFVYLIFLIVITFAVFSNALNNDFTNWDDNHYVTANPYIKNLSFSQMGEIFRVFVSSHYHPFTLLSLAVDLYLWGYNAYGFILGNIIIHILNCVIVFFIFKTLFKNSIVVFIAALLFAVHPMKVESVVWISERKDVLYAFFYLLAIYYYILYVKVKNLKKYYFFTLLLALFALFAKASAASLPLVLIAVDFYFGRNKYLKILIEKIPFFLLSLIFGIIAIIAQSDQPPNSFPLHEKIFLVSYAACFYLLKFFIPVFQSPLYHFPEKINNLLPLKYYISMLIIPLVTLIIYKLKSVRREIIFSLSFFLLAMLLTLIKFPIGPAYLTERYTYIPYIGLIFFVAYLLDKNFEKNQNYFPLVIVSSALVLFAFKTYKQNKIWENSISLWTHVISFNPSSGVAYNNRGDAKNENGDFIGAIEDYNKAIEVNFIKAGVYSNRGNARKEIGDYHGALIDFNLAINVDSNNASAFYNRALTKDKLGDISGAFNDFSKAIKLKPDFTQAYYNRGNVNFMLNNFDNAIADYSESLKLNPNLFDALNNRGGAYYKLEKYENAMADFNNAIKLKPDFQNAYFNRASVFFSTKNIIDACNDLRAASQYGHPDAQSKFNALCIE